MAFPVCALAPAQWRAWRPATAAIRACFVILRCSRAAARLLGCSLVYQFVRVFWAFLTVPEVVAVADLEKLAALVGSWPSEVGYDGDGGFTQYGFIRLLSSHRPSLWIARCLFISHW